MGASQKRRAAFFAKHPTCCFCGGETPATTEDHFPSRSMFRDRAWPEGYVFPACEKCNEASAKKELLIAMLGRVFPDPEEPRHNEQIVELMRSVHSNFPGLLETMRLSATDKRKWLREQDIEMPAGMTTADIGIVSAKDPRIENAAEVFATKLFLALFYFQTGSIVPPEGGVAFRWATNERDIDDVFPKEILAPMLKGFPELKRANTSLQDQFFYRFAIADTKRAGAFLAFFNHSLAMLGFVFPEIQRMAEKGRVRSGRRSPP